MKKLFAVLMSIVLVFTMGTVALAAETGTITITNAVANADYEIYKMADFTPIEGETEKGIYTAVNAWEEFFTTEPATNFFDATEVENADSSVSLVIALKDGVSEVTQDLAKAAIAYAEKKGLAATDTKTAEGTDVEFTGLDLGYYAIDTTVGTMAALTRATNELVLVEKNEKPDITKQVREDSLVVDGNPESGWQYVNDADIDQVVEYRSTITVGLGAVNYIMHDTMEAGLTFNNDVVVKLADGTPVGAANYEVIVSPADGHTFDVKFDDDFIATLAKGDTFTVYYSATLNENANIVVDGNDNTVYLTCGEKSEWETEKHTTTTYTWKIDVLKYTDGDAKTPLAGAKFELQNENGDVIKLSKVEGKPVPTYRVDEDGTVTEIETDTEGEFEIIGLDEGVYFLEETEAPDGYNKLSNPIKVVIRSEASKNVDSSKYYFAVLDEDGNVVTEDGTEKLEEASTIEVENKTGGLFPETGGIGTTIFYIVGALLMLAAVVILVSKKRMATFA